MSDYNTNEIFDGAMPSEDNLNPITSSIPDLIDLNLDSVPEASLVENGASATLEITSLKLKRSPKSGNIYIAVSLNVVSDGEIDYEPIFYNSLILPTVAMDNTKQRRCRRDIAGFCAGFGIDMNDFQSYVINNFQAAASGVGDVQNYTDAKGLQRNAVLSTQESEMGFSNNIKKWL